MREEYPIRLTDEMAAALRALLTVHPEETKAQALLAKYDACKEFRELPKDYQFTTLEAEARKAWALTFITRLTGVAQAMGYGIFVGGSLIRDIDLIAMPWQKLTARGATSFVLDLCTAMNLQLGNHGSTLFGHCWFALWEMNHRDHQIDLKVVKPYVEWTAKNEHPICTPVPK